MDTTVQSGGSIVITVVAYHNENASQDYYTIMDPIAKQVWIELYNCGKDEHAQEVSPECLNAAPSHFRTVSIDALTVISVERESCLFR